MIISQLICRSILSKVTRNVYSNGKQKIKFMSTQNPKPDTKNNVETVHSIGTHMHPVTNFDKRILVWVKRYPSMADVPAQVTRDCILNARSKARVRTCNIMIVISVIGFLIAAISGKREVARGNTLTKRDLEWQKSLRKEQKAAEDNK
ncbi:protein FAM162B-like [Vespa mandarinia]|uniref:protein FAM162B-like n=1 Tax=Vespa mandarinia TaxID=7446 RepID=UPI0016099AE6|nr:protein FAM162B-like [Vespa mandarinia]